MKSCALHSVVPITADEIYLALEQSALDWECLQIEQPDGTVYGTSRSTEWFRFWPDSARSYEEIEALDFFHSLKMPYVWDIQFRDGNALFVISESLRKKHDFVMVNDGLEIFSPNEISIRVSRGEKWW